MSSTRQAVTRGPSLTGDGKRPERTPIHQVLFFTGIRAGTGGSALGSPRIWGTRRKPVSGIRCMLTLQRRPLKADMEIVHCTATSTKLKLSRNFAAEFCIRYPLTLASACRTSWIVTVSASSLMATVATLAIPLITARFKGTTPPSTSIFPNARI